MVKYKYRKYEFVSNFENIQSIEVSQDLLVINTGTHVHLAAKKPFDYKKKSGIIGSL